jgi:hypothetical protein
MRSGDVLIELRVPARTEHAAVLGEDAQLSALDGRHHWSGVEGLLDRGGLGVVVKAPT